MTHIIENFIHRIQTITFHGNIGLFGSLKAVENNAVFAVFSPCMIFFLVLSDQPRMIVKEIKRVSDIVVNVADDVRQEDKKLQNAELDIVSNALETVRHDGEKSVTGFFFSLQLLSDGEILVYFNCCELDADWLLAGKQQFDWMLNKSDDPTVAENIQFFG